MVYIVNTAYAVGKSQEIAYRGKNIVNGNMLRDKIVRMLKNSLAKLFLAVCAFKNFTQSRKGNILVNSELVKLCQLIGCKVGKVGKPYHTV